MNDPGWYGRPLACRVGDRHLVSTGWYLTAFEMMVSTRYYGSRASVEAKNHLCQSVIGFFKNDLCIDITRLVVTVFGGGSILPGVAVPPDLEWADSWRSAGLKQEQILQLHGPKNYLLFAEDGERCGPKCEVMVSLDGPRGGKLLEVATLIADSQILEQDASGQFAIREGCTIAAGMAFGLERVAAVAAGLSGIHELEPFRSWVEIVQSASRQPGEVLRLMEGDVVSLVDQVMATLFLLSGPVEIYTEKQRGLVTSMLGRVKRRLKALEITNEQECVLALSTAITNHHGGVHGTGFSRADRLWSLIARIPWPAAYNPDSHRAYPHDSISLPSF